MQSSSVVYIRYANGTRAYAYIVWHIRQLLRDKSLKFGVKLSIGTLQIVFNFL